MWKNVLPVYSVGIRTHNLQGMSLANCAKTTAQVEAESTSTGEMLLIL